MKNLTPKTEAAINLSAIVVVIAINYAIAAGWLGGMTQKSSFGIISNRHYASRIYFCNLGRDLCRSTS